MKKLTILLLGLGLLLVFSPELVAKRPAVGGDGAIPGHVSISVDGAVVADQDCDVKLGADTTIYTCNKAGTSAETPHKISLGDFFMKVGEGSRIYPTGASADHCFGEGVFNVTMQVMLNRDSSAETVLRFWALKGYGDTEILYVLNVNDPDGWRDTNDLDSPGDFPPQLNEGVIMGESNAVSWNLTTSKRNVTEACVDSGTFPDGEDYINVIFARDL